MFKWSRIWKCFKIKNLLLFFMLFRGYLNSKCPQVNSLSFLGISDNSTIFYFIHIFWKLKIKTCSWLQWGPVKSDKLSSWVSAIFLQIKLCSSLWDLAIVPWNNRIFSEFFQYFNKIGLTADALYTLNLPGTNFHEQSCQTLSRMSFWNILW